MFGVTGTLSATFNACDLALQGFIEKKGGKTLGISGSWQSRFSSSLFSLHMSISNLLYRYFVMKKPCMLTYYKDQNTTTQVCVAV